MNILVLAEDLRINQSSGGICNSNVIASILSGGHSITCVYDMTDDDNFSWINNGNIHFRPIRPKKLSKMNGFLSKFNKWNPIQILFYGHTPSAYLKINAWKEEIKLLLQAESFDCILVLSCGMSFSPHFAMAELNPKVAWIAHIHDPYPLHQYPEPYKRKGNRLIEKREWQNTNDIFKRATKVSFPSLRLAEWMSGFHPILGGKYFIMPHSSGKLGDLPTVDTDKAVHLDKNKFNIIHAGTLLGPRDPKALINAFNRFLSIDESRRETSCLTVVGKIDRKYSNIVENNSNNINIVDSRISYAHSKKLYKDSTVLIIIEAQAKNSPFMPGKLADYIVSDKPILAITPPTSEVSRLLGEAYPYMAENGDEDRIFTIIEQLWQRWKKKEPLKLDRPELLEYVSHKHGNEILENALVK